MLAIETMRRARAWQRRRRSNVDTFFQEDL
jgi:hypothetical protein